MNSQSIKTFITLAKLNSFSQTATSLYISQSTVTKRICELEKEVGKPLFYRDKKHVSLTEDGRIFLKYATRIVELEEASLKEMHSSVTYENSLRIGSTNSIYECHLFPLISGFESASKTLCQSHDWSFFRYDPAVNGRHFRLCLYIRPAGTRRL